MKNFLSFSRTCLLHTFLLALLALCQFSAWGQGWERTYDFYSGEKFGHIVLMPDGSFTMLNYQSVWASLQGGSFLLNADQDGSEVWNSLASNFISGNQVAPAPGGGYYIAGMEIIDFAVNAHVGLIRTDALGQTLWEQLYLFDPDYFYHNATALYLNPDGTVMSGGAMGPGQSNPPPLSFFFKTDADGNQLWVQQYDQSEVGNIYAIYPVSDGYLLAGDRGGNGTWGDAEFSLSKTDADGNLLWSTGWGDPMPFTRPAMLTSGDVMFAASDTNSMFQPVILLSKADQQGNIIFEKEIEVTAVGLDWDVAVESISPTADGGAVLVANELFEAVVVKLDANGDVEWFKVFSGGSQTNNVEFFDVKQTADGGYIIGGYRVKNGESKAYLVRLDALGQLYDNHVSGNIFSDDNENCQPDAGEAGAPSWIVKAASADDVWFATADADGNYALEVPPTTLEVSIANPHPYVSYCPGSAQVTFSGPGEDATVDFGMLDTIDCPLLEVSFYSWQMRRCFENKYMGQVCNIGTVTAEGATLEVSLDPWLTYTSSDLPLLSQNGQLLTFDLGDLEPDECLDFKIFFDLDCDAPVGLTHCSEAHAYPDSLCLPDDPEWDGSSIIVSGECRNEDTIRFTLQNVGNGDMQQASQLIVIEDHMIMLADPFQLPTGAEKTIDIEATGATYRLEADQCPGHPGQSFPSVTVEGCGAGQGLVISTGLVNMFPMDDADPWIDIDCRQNTGSYDPNQKEAFPEGFLENHLIERNTDIEYLIQFQNTGTDTALLVVIRDTLSPFLNPGTIRPGASSHPYQFEMTGQGVAKFAFPDIMLPDSNVNEPMSHGFVSFRISQKTDNPLGSVIKNSAAIYFDFNEPIITNETFHTVGENFITVSVDPGPARSNSLVKVYPNPFAGSAFFEVKNFENQPLALKIFDTTGRLVQEVSAAGSPIEFHRNGLPEGMYFFKIENEGRVLGTGKMIVD